MTKPKLSPTMKSALAHFEQHQNFDGYSSRTVSALQRRNLIEATRTGHPLTTQNKSIVQESAGNLRPQLSVQWYDQFSHMPTFDGGQTDYLFWDRAFQGKAEGLELAGLFLKPLASKKAAWVLGMLPKIKVEHEYTQGKIVEWFTDNHSSILRAYEESVKKADCYTIVNPDMSITVVPPNVVVPLVDDNDYSRLTGWEIRETYQHPTRMGDVMNINDSYTVMQRTRTIWRNRGRDPEIQRFRNLIQQVPVVHIANNRGSDERFGHAEGEPLLHALHFYGQLFEDAIAGNRKQGRPTPVMERLGTADQVAKFWELFGKTRRYFDEKGDEQTETYIDIASDSVLTLGGEATFKWAAPGPFANESQILLGLLFYLVLQHSEIPEFVWGNAITSSHASAEAQMPPFVKWIQKEQGRVEDWLLPLLNIVYAFLQLTDPQIRGGLKISVNWMPLTNQDDRLTLEAIRLGLDKGLLDDETALALMPLDIEKPAEVLKKLKAQVEQESKEFEERANRLALQNEPDEDDEDDADMDEDTESEDSEIEEIISAAQAIVRQNGHNPAKVKEVAR